MDTLAFAGRKVLVAQGVYDEKIDDFHAFPIKRYVIKTSPKKIEKVNAAFMKLIRGDK